MRNKTSVLKACLMVWLRPDDFSRENFEKCAKMMVLAFHPDRYDESQRPFFERRMQILNQIREDIKTGYCIDDRSLLK